MTTLKAEAGERLEYFPAPETHEIRRAVRDWVSDHAGTERAIAQRLGDEPWDRGLWQAAAGDLGLGSLLLPEALGGVAGTYEQAAAVFEEFGRGLLAVPILGNLAFGLGALLPLINRSNPDPTLAALARDIADGAVTVALAAEDTRGAWNGKRPQASAHRGAFALDGECGLVVDAPRAQRLLVFAGPEDQLGLYLVDTADARVLARPTLDPSQELADISFADTPAILLADDEDARDAMRHALVLARVAIAALSLGGAQAALDEAVQYALTRKQFGQPIAGFQAVKHLCANALLAIQQARAVVSYATWALDDGSPESERALLAAKIAATQAYTQSAATAVQLFGAMGTTREVSVQVHFRRARFLALLLGPDDVDLATLADRLGFTP